MTVCDRPTPENARTTHHASHYTARRLFVRLVSDALRYAPPEWPEHLSRRAVAEMLADGALAPEQVLGLAEMGPARGPRTYFMRMETGSQRAPIKIGSSVDPAARRAAISTDSPYPIAILATYPGSLLGEYELHGALRRHRIRLEWFRPAPVILALVDILGTAVIRRSPR